MNNLEMLKELATEKGIEYHHKIGEAKLQAKITAFDTSIAHAQLRLDEAEASTRTPDVPVFKPLTTKEKIMMRKKIASQLIRVNITCMNPAKKGWKGDIFSVGSAQLGTYKKFVPFNSDYHIPRIIYNEMKLSKCSFFREVKAANGNPITVCDQKPEYNIATLDPLTVLELKDLAAIQAAAGNID